MSSVGIARIQNDTTDSFRQAILESLRIIDYSFNKSIKTVVIKPNLCYYWDYSTGQTTDPRFVAALVDLIREKISPNQISIVESDASAMKCTHVFKMLGYEKLSQDCDVRLVNLSKDKYELVETNVENQAFHIMVPQTIQDADLKINVPKIKYTIEKIKITCALKNIFGCNPYPKKFRYHPQLEKAIVACNKVMRFDLCIIDGNIVSGIESRKLGLVMASQDLVAIDAAAAKIAGLSPKTIRYLRLAEKEGLGKISFVNRGIPLDHFRSRYPCKTVSAKIKTKAYAVVSRVGLGTKLGLE